MRAMDKQGSKSDRISATLGSGFWWLSKNKYLMMPITTLSPKPDPDIWLISARVLGPEGFVAVTVKPSGKSSASSVLNEKKGGMT